MVRACWVLCEVFPTLPGPLVADGTDETIYEVLHQCKRIQVIRRDIVVRYAYARDVLQQTNDIDDEKTIYETRGDQQRFWRNLVTRQACSCCNVLLNSQL